MEPTRPQEPWLAERHLRRARYLRAMARSAYMTDVALTLIQLALHYEKLAAAASGTPSLPMPRSRRAKNLA